MASHSVNLEGMENLPPVLRECVDPNYHHYATHKYSIVTSENGVEHFYSVILSNRKLSVQDSAQIFENIGSNKTGNKIKVEELVRPVGNTTGHLVSQISSTTTSEKRMSTNKLSPIAIDSSLSVGKTVVTTSSAGSSDFSPRKQRTITPVRKALVRPYNSFLDEEISSSCYTTSSMHSKTNLSEYSYLSPTLKSSRSSKFVMMVYVKFVLLHRDIFKRRVQSVFNDEFPSDCTLEDVIYNFHQLSSRKLNQKEFRPRFAYCVGSLNQKKSKPVMASDMSKTLAQLANSHSVAKFALIVDNINEQ
uniref:Uncharacterized protein n=1 Tax=Caenorhabditis japonica TaxID=281687 RepID=A0A8R1HT76_CAEJA